MNSHFKWAGLLLILLLGAHLAYAQRRRGGWGEGYISNADTVKTAREVESHSTGTPNWTNAPGFERDVFTFVRVRYSSARERSYSRRAGDWITDFPDSDLNLSFRLQQMTSMRVDPDGRVVNLTDPELFNYPWIYMVEPGALSFEEEEIPILRNYLLNGGFLMADDFWGEEQWANFARQIKIVLPNHSFVDVPMDHGIFQGIFQLKGPKNKMQVPNVRTGVNSQYTHETWEYHDGEACSEVHIRAIYDEKGHMMVLALHNTDNGDGWEREGENDFYFHRFSENIAFPLAINIMFYTMSH